MKEGSDRVVYSAEEEVKRLEAFLRKRMRSFSHPFQVKRCGRDQVSLKFQVRDPSQIYNLIRKLALRNGCSRMMHIESSTAVELALKSAEKHDINQRREDEKMVDHEASLDVCFLVDEGSPVIELVKHGRFSSKELRLALSTLRMMALEVEAEKSPSIEKSLAWTQAHRKETVDALEAMCVRVYLGEDCYPGIESEGAIFWGRIAGYKEQKREIEDVLALPLRCSNVHDAIANGTRGTFEPNRPRAILFEGPPGTGKTACVKAIGASGIPLLHLPLELFISEHDTQSGKMLAKVFSLADNLPNESLIFLDEVESMVRNHDCVKNEISSGVLSVLLNQMTRFQGSKKIVIIAATNCKVDLDPHFIRLFNHIITFGLPDLRNRIEIISHYVKHLTDSDVSKLARATYEMSAKDILSVCQRARTRCWVMESVRCWGVFPNIDEHLESAMAERNEKEDRKGSAQVRRKTTSEKEDQNTANKEDHTAKKEDQNSYAQVQTQGKRKIMTEKEDQNSSAQVQMKIMTEEEDQNSSAQVQMKIMTEEEDQNSSAQVKTQVLRKIVSEEKDSKRKKILSEEEEFSIRTAPLRRKILSEEEEFSIRTAT